MMQNEALIHAQLNNMELSQNTSSMFWSYLAQKSAYTFFKT